MVNIEKGGYAKLLTDHTNTYKKLNWTNHSTGEQHFQENYKSLPTETLLKITKVNKRDQTATGVTAHPDINEVAYNVPWTSLEAISRVEGDILLLEAKYQKNVAYYEKRGQEWDAAEDYAGLNWLDERVPKRKVSNYWNKSETWLEPEGTNRGSWTRNYSDADRNSPTKWSWYPYDRPEMSTKQIEEHQQKLTNLRKLAGIVDYLRYQHHKVFFRPAADHLDALRIYEAFKDNPPKHIDLSGKLGRVWW